MKKWEGGFFQNLGCDKVVKGGGGGITPLIFNFWLGPHIDGEWGEIFPKVGTVTPLIN